MYFGHCHSQFILIQFRLPVETIYCRSDEMSENGNVNNDIETQTNTY